MSVARVGRLFCQHESKASARAWNRLLEAGNPAGGRLKEGRTPIHRCAWAADEWPQFASHGPLIVEDAHRVIGFISLYSRNRKTFRGPAQSRRRFCHVRFHPRSAYVQREYHDATLGGHRPQRLPVLHQHALEAFHPQRPTPTVVLVISA